MTPTRCGTSSAPRTALLLALVAALLVGLTGCASALSKPSPERQYYGLQALRVPAANIQYQPHGVLKVRDITVTAPFASRELVYKTGPAAYQTDYYNMFLVQPAKLAGQAARDWMADTGLFATVIQPGVSLRADYLLEGNLLELYGDFTRQPPQAVLAVQFFLLDESALEQNLVMERTYRQRVDLSEPSPQGLVAAYNQGLTAILSQLEADLAQVLASR